MHGPDPIPIGRATLTQLIFHWFYEHFQKSDGFSTAGAQFSENHHFLN